MENSRVKGKTKFTIHHKNGYIDLPEWEKGDENILGEGKKIKNHENEKNQEDAFGHLLMTFHSHPGGAHAARLSGNGFSVFLRCHFRGRLSARPGRSIRASGGP
jgi:hypothetical protein